MVNKSAKHICPYYNRETAQMIVCDGIAPNSTLETGFTSIKAKREYKETYCEGVFFRCPKARLLNTQWKRYEIASCKWNEGVECVDLSQCDRCGWNPVVAQRRLCAFLHQDDTRSKCRAATTNDPK